MLPMLLMPCYHVTNVVNDTRAIPVTMLPMLLTPCYNVTVLPHKYYVVTVETSRP